MIPLELDHCVWTELPASEKGATIRFMHGDVEYRTAQSSETKHLAPGQTEIHEGPVEVHSLAHKSVIHYRVIT